MNIALLIIFIACVGLVSVVIVKPNLSICGHQISIYWTVPLIGAFLLVVTGQIQLSEVIVGLTADHSINPIKILVLFISMTILSIYLDEAGFFRYMANMVLKKASGSQKMLFLCLYCLVAVLTVFTSNDIIILTFTPFICYFAKSAKIDPMPYLFAEFVAANTWSMALIIGNPTNVYLATTNGITFISYASKMILPTIGGGITAFVVLYMIFYRKLQKKILKVQESVTIEDKPAVAIGVIYLTACTIILVISSYVDIEMWCVSLASAICLLFTVMGYNFMRGRKNHVLKRCLMRAPWELIPFVISMFVFVLVIADNGLTKTFASLMDGVHGVWKYGISSFLAANIINNIPMSVLFCSILENASENIKEAGTYAAIAGSNIGALLSPIGALAGIMWSGILKKHQVSFSFIKFIQYGVIVSIPTLLVTLLGIYFCIL